MFADAETFNKKVHAFFLGIGTVEVQRMKSLSDALKKAGIHNTYYEPEGTAHERLTWRRCLHEFATLLFKSRYENLFIKNIVRGFFENLQ